MIFLEFHDVGLQGDIVREIGLGSAQQAQGFIVALLGVSVVSHILEAEYGFGVPLFGGKFVGGFGAIEELLDALDGQRLHLVDHLATAVVALTGQALGVFIGEVRYIIPMKALMPVTNSHIYHHLTM